MTTVVVGGSYEWFRAECIGAWIIRCTIPLDVPRRYSLSPLCAICVRRKWQALAVQPVVGEVGRDKKLFFFKISSLSSYLMSSMQLFW